MNAEYALDISQVESVVHEIRDLLRNLYQEGRVINFPRFHLRFAPASTNTLLGMNQGRKTCFFAHYGSGATKPWKQIDIFKNIERILDSHGGRPHWGKTRYLGQDTKFYSYYDGNYEKFESYRKKLDPNSVFSDGLEMFKGINLFEKRKFLQKPFSGWNKNNYFPIRFLGGRSSKL